MHKYSFENLDVWRLSKNLSIHIYKITSHFPRGETYSLIPQMRRSSISIASNIAEGSGRNSQNPQEQA